MMSTRDADVREITTNEYAGFQRLIGDASGITLGSGKRQLLVGRVARSVRERGLDTYGEYLEIVRADRTGQELERLLDLVTTNETRFFREAPHYRYITEELCPLWRSEAHAGETTPSPLRQRERRCSYSDEANWLKASPST